MMKNNGEKLKCDYYVPLGKPGSIVAKIPIVLCDVKISIPISAEVNIDECAIILSSNYTKVSINHFNLNCDNKFTIDGLILKLIEYSFPNDPNTYCKVLKIPLNKSFIIKFINSPIYPTHLHDYTYKNQPHPIECNIEYINSIGDSFEKNSSKLINKFFIEIRLSLTQIQNVFIPEPDGDVLLLRKDSPNFIHNKIQKSPQYIVGNNPRKGLIADVISKEE